MVHLTPLEQSCHHAWIKARTPKTTITAILDSYNTTFYRRFLCIMFAIIKYICKIISTTNNNLLYWRQNIWLPTVISVSTNTKVYLLWICVFFVCFSDSKNCIRWTHFDIAPPWTTNSILCTANGTNILLQNYSHTHPFNGPLSGTTQVSRYQKGKTSLDFTEARDSEWQWHQLGRVQVCTLLQTDNHTSIPPLSFLQAGCPSCHQTNSVKALKTIQRTEI